MKLSLLISAFALAFTAQSQTNCPCASPAGCTVTNYNGKLARISGDKNVNIIRVIMPGRTNYTMSQVKANANNFINFVNTASCGRLTLTIKPCSGL